MNRSDEHFITCPTCRDGRLLSAAGLLAIRGDYAKTQAQAAEAAGISPAYLSELERGGKPLRAELVDKILGGYERAWGMP